MLVAPRSVVAGILTAALLPLTVACTTTSGGESESESTEVETSEAGSSEDTAESAVDKNGESGATDLSNLALGPTQDENLKTVLYDALKAQIEAEGRSGGITSTAGDIETFEFTIVRLTQGDDDVSSDPRGGADGIEVEISGWLQKTMPADGSTKSECFGFDTQAPARKTKDGWAVPAGHVFKFSREDAEDCY